VTIWDGEETTAEVEGCAPEIWPPTASATCRLDGVDVTLVRDGDRVRWVGRNGPVEVRLDDQGRPERVAVAGVVAERVEGIPPTPDPVDPAELLTLPSPSFPAARRSHVATFEIDGVPTRVDAPTRAEIPPAAEPVGALVREVRERIAAAAVPGRRSGRRALEVGSGDCTEQALALVELARARGFEARTAAGRVYVDDPRPGLALHAWAEVRVGDRWYAADPALDQFPADATHLRLGEWIADLAAWDGRSIRLVEVR
jgi:transglutaminase-like putative cysteine protease